MLLDKVHRRHGLLLTVVATALAQLLLPCEAAAQDAAAGDFPKEVVERALASLDVDVKFIALMLAQRGLVKDVVTAEVSAVAKRPTYQPIVIIGTAFTVGSEAEVSEVKCAEINIEIQKWVLGGLWKQIPPDGFTHDGGRTSEAVRRKELPADMQLRSLIRRFKGYLFDPETEFAQSAEQWGSELKKYTPVYNSLAIRVSLLEPSYVGGTSEYKSVACSSRDNKN